MRRKLAKVILIWGVLFCFWIGYQIIIDGNEDSYIYRVIGDCILPSGFFIYDLFGLFGSHNLITFITGMIITVTTSIVFYVGIAWLIIVAFAQYKSRHNQ
jgi:hypothetical protein